MQNDLLFTYRLVTTPTFRPRLSSVLSKFSHILKKFIRESPPEGVARGGPSPTPSTRSDASGVLDQ